MSVDGRDDTRRHVVGIALLPAKVSLRICTCSTAVTSNGIASCPAAWSYATDPEYTSGHAYEAHIIFVSETKYGERFMRIRLTRAFQIRSDVASWLLDDLTAFHSTSRTRARCPPRLLLCKIWSCILPKSNGACTCRLRSTWGQS